MNDDVTIWPDAVNDAANNMVEAIQDLLDPEETSEHLLREQLSKHLLEKFIAGETLLLTEEEFERAYAIASVHTTLQRLTEGGFVQSVEDEDGEPVYWLTEQGKIKAEEYKDLKPESQNLAVDLL